MFVLRHCLLAALLFTTATGCDTGPVSTADGEIWEDLTTPRILYPELEPIDDLRVPEEIEVPLTDDGEEEEPIIPCSTTVSTAYDGWSVEGGSADQLLLLSKDTRRSLHNVSADDDLAVLLRVPAVDVSGLPLVSIEATAIREASESSILEMSLVSVSTEGQGAMHAKTTLSRGLGQHTMTLEELGAPLDGVAALYVRVWFENAGVENALGLLSVTSTYCPLPEPEEDVEGEASE